MVKVVFVGDKPSKNNISDDIAFVGAACFIRLVEWIKKINPDFYVCLNSETERELLDIETLLENGFKVIALGVFASARLRDRDVPHFAIPHPSGRNVKNNDQALITSQLEKAWLYSRGELHE